MAPESLTQLINTTVHDVDNQVRINGWQLNPSQPVSTWENIQNVAGIIEKKLSIRHTDPALRKRVWHHYFESLDVNSRNALALALTTPQAARARLLIAEQKMHQTDTLQIETISLHETITYAEQFALTHEVMQTGQYLLETHQQITPQSIFDRLCTSPLIEPQDFHRILPSLEKSSTYQRIKEGKPSARITQRNIETPETIDAFETVVAILHAMNQNVTSFRDIIDEKNNLLTTINEPFDTAGKLVHRKKMGSTEFRKNHVDIAIQAFEATQLIGSEEQKSLEQYDVHEALVQLNYLLVRTLVEIPALQKDLDQETANKLYEMGKLLLGGENKSYTSRYDRSPELKDAHQKALKQLYERFNPNTWKRMTNTIFQRDS